MSSATLWGWDATVAAPQWRKLLVDDTGYLLTTPAAGATFDSHCYGWHPAGWQALRVESNVHPNLRTRLYVGTNPIDFQLAIPATVPPGNRVLQTAALLYAYDGTNYRWLSLESNVATNLRTRLYAGAHPIGMQLAIPATVPPANQVLQTASLLYAYDGANYRWLLLESAANPNLRVGLYKGGSEANIGGGSLAFAYGNIGLQTFATLYGDDGTNVSRVGMLLAGADGVDNA
ncbi:unnamed protein product, partial [marine sediment metagenome]